MPSLSLTAAPGPFLVCLANFLSVLVFLGSPSAARGASLVDRRLLRGGGGGADVHAPDVDMLKALEYMEGLRQGAGADAPRYDDDADKLRAVLRLVANPVQSKEEEEEGEEEEGREDKSEELLQAVLSTLQRTEGKASQPAAPLRPRPQPRRGGILPHEKLPLMFEDDEDDDEEGEEEEGERGRSPFKRTNENVEEKYTPQNLATLQSVFDELDKMTSAKSAQRRGDGDVEEEEDGEDEDDMFNVRNVGYDDGDLAVWGPPQEEEEEEKHEADRGLDYVDDNEEDEDEEDPGESYPVKRSSEPDDVANLVDYYLLKVLEKTEEEEQKREIEEEEEEEEEEKQRAERGAQHRGDIDPRAVYQLIRISQKYQIPPEDLVDMLRTGETMKSGGGAPRAGNELPRVPPKKTRLRIPEAKFHSRQKTPEERRTEEILGILGLGPAEPRVSQYKSSPSRLRTRPAPPRSGGSAPAQRRPPPKDDDNSDYNEDELAAFLSARMPPRYPKLRGRWGQKRDEVTGQSAAAAAGSFERAAQAYFDQMDSDSSHEEKRRAEEEGEETGGEETGGEETRMRGFDNEAVMKLLSALNAETTGSDDTTGRGF